MNERSVWIYDFSGTASSIAIEEVLSESATVALADLTDDELIEELKAYGAEIGPILRKR